MNKLPALFKYWNTDDCQNNLNKRDNAEIVALIVALRPTLECYGSINNSLPVLDKRRRKKSLTFP